AAALYREGAGFSALIPFNVDYSFARRVPTSGPSTGLPVDNDDNGSDFLFVDTNGTSAGAGQRLGAPGPKNLSSARDTGATIGHSAIDPLQADTAAPNVGRDFTSDPPNNATFGRLSIRRKFTNNTGADITSLRFRVINLSTFPSPSGIADLRPTTSGGAIIALTGGGNTFVQGTTLEQPPSQPNGGGFNSSLGVNTISPGSPFANGASVDVQFMMGIQQTGCYELAVIAESLPGGGSDVFTISGDTDGSGVCGGPTPTPGGTSLVISEFRVRGFQGANDEFVEIYNNTDTDHTVASSDGSSGYALAASDGVARFVIPNGTVIPARGHYLGVNSVAYSLAFYPAGNGNFATGDAGFTTNIPDNDGVALFNTSNAANFTLANRFDAVGSTSAAALYREGAGFAALIPFNVDYSFARRVP
ncbi:MAG TPA: lamin tail domain-containing protein, partial [Pyrinomonadaceae bacterium]|nr:lamin tail domain-containing protein [Pyrinomonadaceae bacterium]